MKTLILSCFAVCGVLILSHPTHAAPEVASVDKPKSYGGFPPGTEFVLEVSQVSGIPKNKPFPSGVPRFRRGDRVKFIIGDLGQLTGPKISAPFHKASPRSNEYVMEPRLLGGKEVNASLAKSENGKAVGLALTFSKTGSGPALSGYIISYELVRKPATAIAGR
ncbi:MAG: hypothetical protein V4689_07115 [Verrucomicrobiota bacterium]